MLILMRETPSGKVWPCRLFENHDAWLHWAEDQDGESDIFEEGVGVYYLMEGSFYQNLHQPNILYAFEWDIYEDGFVFLDIANKTWHEDGDWW